MNIRIMNDTINFKFLNTKQWRASRYNRSDAYRRYNNANANRYCMDKKSTRKKIVFLTITFIKMIKKIWNNKDFRYFAWTVFNAGIAFIVTQLSWLEWEGAMIVTWMAIPFLNVITKYMNTKYFGDFGVKK